MSRSGCWSRSVRSWCAWGVESIGNIADRNWSVTKNEGPIGHSKTELLYQASAWSKSNCSTLRRDGCRGEKLTCNIEESAGLLQPMRQKKALERACFLVQACYQNANCSNQFCAKKTDEVQRQRITGRYHVGVGFAPFKNLRSKGLGKCRLSKQGPMCFSLVVQAWTPRDEPAKHSSQASSRAPGIVAGKGRSWPSPPGLPLSARPTSASLCEPNWGWREMPSPSVRKSS